MSETRLQASSWHALAPQAVLDQLAGSAGGLTGQEAEARFRRYGPNLLPQPRRDGPIRRFIRQFRNVLIYVLLVAGVITALLGEYLDSGVIFGVVVLNAIIGFIQEGKAEAALAAIRGMLAPEAVVLRDGDRRRIPAEQLVPGDVVLLKAGDRVPADLRLLEAHALEIQEAVLTGESLAVAKASAAVAPEAVLAERYGMAYSGTMVAFGTGQGVVVGTGTDTEIGRISSMLNAVEAVETPLAKQMEGFARWLTGAILGLAGAMMIFGALLHDFGWVEMFMAAVGLAVSAIPEGLPAIVTISMAIGVTRMARRKAITRHLPTVETLGSVSVIFTDKTGTLTRNELAVDRLITPEGEYAGVELDAAGNTPDIRAAMDTALLCNDAEPAKDGAVLGNPTDVALLGLGERLGFDIGGLRRSQPRLDVIPFDSRYKMMAVLAQDAGGGRSIRIKGAPEVLIARCTGPGFDPVPWLAAVADLAAQGMRVIALARKPVDPHEVVLDFSELEGGMQLLALVGLHDPPRPEVADAVAACRAAGISVKMITGDHAATARTIAGLTGILDDGMEEAVVLTGRDIDAMDADALSEAAERVHVFARTTPAHKLRLVEALQARGHIAAMTGDGVNDSPALKRADVGVAMGQGGTEAARQAADIVLGDDNFATIAAAVEEGRTVFENLKKAIMFILPASCGASLIILAAVLVGGVLPISPTQILWVNMITTVTLALALGFEPPEGSVMQRPPRDPSIPILDGFLIWRIGFVSILILLAGYGLFLDALARGLSLEAARALTVTMMVSGSIAYLLNMHRSDQPVWSPSALFGNPWLWPAIGVTLGAQLLFLYWDPLTRLFAVAPPDLADWSRIGMVTLGFFLAMEAEKLVVGLVRDWRRG